MRLAAAGAAALTGVVLLAGAAAAPSAGERAFQKCYACHSVDPAETGLPGPNLAGVVGRRAGALAGFDYSLAMKAAGAKGLVWSRAALDRFLIDPQSVVPGTAMERPHLQSAEERRAAIDYLAEQRRRPSS